MFPQSIFSPKRNLSPLRGGDPVGSEAAAFCKVSITPHDIREELSYLTDIHYSSESVSGKTVRPRFNFSPKPRDVYTSREHLFMHVRVTKAPSSCITRSVDGLDRLPPPKENKNHQHITLRSNIK